MADIKGDPDKQPEECKLGGSCPHIQCIYEGFDGERWNCDVCGERYFLDYEDMK